MIQNDDTNVMIMANYDGKNEHIVMEMEMEIVIEIVMEIVKTGNNTTK